jgi:hypothetical protein
MTTVGFEPTLLRTAALTQRLRPLGQMVFFFFSSNQFIGNLSLLTYQHLVDLNQIKHNMHTVLVLNMSAAASRATPTRPNGFFFFFLSLKSVYR